MDRQQATTAEAGGATDSRELISRWMDGDIEEHEVELVLRTLDTEAGRQIWAELHAVGDCLRGLPPASPSCQGRILAALAAEPPILAPAPRRERRARQAASQAKPSIWSRFQRDGRVLAAAASIAAVGFVATTSFQLLRSPAAPSPGSLAATSTPTPVTHVSQANWNAYLRAHQESADATSLHAVRQYLRPVSTQVSE